MFQSNNKKEFDIKPRPPLNTKNINYTFLKNMNNSDIILNSQKKLMLENISN